MDNIQEPWADFHWLSTLTMYIDANLSADAKKNGLILPSSVSYRGSSRERPIDKTHCQSY